MKVLIIPEDFRLDQFILTPLLGKLLRKVLGPRTRVDICRNPVLGGVSEALKINNLKAIVSMYPMVDVFILCVDRDGVLTRRQTIDRIEHELREVLDQRVFFGEVAIEEIETWLLAGHDLPFGWRWNDIRAERDPKEVYFVPFAEQRGLVDSPGGGRSILATEASRNLSRILSRCREDIGNLTSRLLALR